MLLVLGAFSAQAQSSATVNLSVSKKISKQNPALGDVISYTVIVRNAAGSATATNVVVKDQLPVGGVSYVAGSATTVRGTGTYVSDSGLWSLRAIAPNDSAVLTLQATVLNRGVWFNTAEVIAVDQADSNSQPNNNSLIEDDYAAICFSVPIFWYAGDEFTVSIPSGYKNVTWYRNDQTLATVAASLAVINADSSLTIKSPGNYRFTTTINGCSALNCCDIEIIQGPYGSLGDYVFVDANKDGIQNAGDSPLAGVKVTLFINGVSSQTAVTNSSGFYSFADLSTGNTINYSVGFTAPSGYTVTVANQGGDPMKDSDADPITGITQSVTLAAGEFNSTLDAGYYSICSTDFSLTTSSDAVLCFGDSTRLTAFSPVADVKLSYYLTQTGGTPVASVTSGIPVTVNPTVTTTYFVEASANGCTSARKPIVVTVNLVQTPIVQGTVRNTCPAQTVNLATVAVTNDNPALTYEWYTSPARSQTTRVTNLTTVGAGQYYLYARSGESCYSSPAVVTVEVTNCGCPNPAAVQLSSGLTTCAINPVTLKATISGSATSVTWTSTGTGTFSAPTGLTNIYTPSLTDATSGTVLITATTDDPDGVCTASASSVILKISKRPEAPVNAAPDEVSLCQGGSTKLVAYAPNARINWYDQSGILLTTTESGAKVTVKPALVGANTYYAETVSADNCTSAARTPVTVTVTACQTLADLAVVKNIVTAGPYSVGQKVTYLITASNNGPLAGTDVKVNDLLPATLTFGSASPAGEYNAATGVWTIGTLTPGLNRTLSIEATITSTGAIRNTAIISGTNNDPKFALNDTSTVVVPVGTCTVQPPSITCAVTDICRDETTTLKATGCATGTVRWSDGQTGLTINVKPIVTTTYSASCVASGGCISAASNLVTITVSDPQIPTLVASAAIVCPGGSVTLTATGCAGGVIEWSEGAQIGPSIVVNPYTKTTYTAQCWIGSCLSKPATKTIDIATDSPTPTITASATAVCPGKQVTLTVTNCVGTPVWNTTTATTSSIIVAPTTGNNSYTVYCRTGSCASKASPTLTVQVVPAVPPTVSADTDTTCVKGKVVLTADGCTGTVLWSDKQTGSSISVYPEASISYYAQCKTNDNCLSDPSNSVAITVVSPSAPIIKTDKSLVCSGQLVSLTATGCNGTVKWYGADKVGAIAQILPTETKDYYATCKVGTCESSPSNRIRITVTTSAGTPPTIAASSLSICNSGIVSLTATGCSGDVIWSDGQRGVVVSVTATTTNKTFYAVCKPVNSTACATGQSNVVTINVTATPTPVITRCVCSADTICPGEKVKLSVSNCQGTPHWSTNETTTSITVSPTVTTSYTVYCQDGICRSTVSRAYTVTVVPIAAPTIVASATSVAPGGLITLTATGCVGEVIWSANDRTGNNKGSVLVVQPDGIQTYYAQCKFHDCLSEPSNSITVNKVNCTAKTGTLLAVSPSVCIGTSTTVTVAATPGGGLVMPTGYSVLYVLTKGTGLIIDQTSATPNFTVAAQTAEYTIHTFVYNPNPADRNYLDLSIIKPGITSATDVLKLVADKNVCAELDLAGAKINVRSVAPPLLSSTASKTVCYGSRVALTAVGCESGIVNWSIGLVGQRIETVANSDLAITATCTLDGCVSTPSSSIAIKLGTPNIPSIAVNKPVACIGETVSLTATGCSAGTYVWSDPASTTGSVLTVTPISTTQYRVKCKVGECTSEWSAANTIQVGTPVAPVVSVVGSTASATVCSGTPISLTATGCPDNTSVVWSNDQIGRSITVTLTTSATYTARCTGSTQCVSNPSNRVTITVLPKIPQPSVVDKTNTCPFNTVDLRTAVTSAAATTGGVFEYYTNASLSSGSRVVSPTTVGMGTYYVVEKTTTGCYSLPAIVHVQINTCTEQTPCDSKNPAVADAGADASICAAKSYQLTGKIGGAAKTAYWKTSGTGTFDNPYSLNATYTASAGDITAGKVTLTLSASTNNTSCPVAQDEMVLTVGGAKTVPVITVIGSTSLCYGDSVRLRASDGATSYLWSTKATTQTIVVKTSGVYSVQVLDAQGCSSVKSENVVVNVADPVLPPLVTNLRNECPAKIVNLTKALSATTAGSSYSYRICACVTSNIVIRPDSVGEGTYWVVERGATGCLSTPAKVEVKVFNCAADTLNTDVSIVKTANKSVVKRGETVTYTITVSNNGMHTAYNVDVRDVLPKGLELVPGLPPTYSLTNGIIRKRIDSLPVGKTESIVFSARLTAKGEVVNTAEITYLDNKDTNLANNVSSVTVKDTSDARTGVIGLAKAVVGTPVVTGDSLINVRYSFVVTNFGNDTLRQVQVVDDLATVFGSNQIRAATISTTNADFTLNANAAFTGTGTNTSLFDSTSYLVPGRSQMFFLDVTVKRTAGDTTNTFRNIASVSALSNGTKIEDRSVDGGDVDPDNDGDPTNNTSFTVFSLSQSNGPRIGVALAVVKVERQPDNSYNVTYKATVRNFGNVALYGVSLIDSLVKTFTSPTSFSIVGSPVVGAGSHLVANASFNGGSSADLLTNASYLNASEQDTVLLTVNVKPSGTNGPFYSSITGQGYTADRTLTVRDISNNGLDPKPEGSVATGVRFDLPPALLGVAKSVGSPTLVAEGIYDVVYTIKLSNLGSVPLQKVQVVDNLSQTFGRGALIVSNRIGIATDAGLKADTSYTGQGLVTKMLVDSLSTLPVGATRRLAFTVRVNVKNASAVTFYNTAYATAQTAGNVAVADTSTSGTNDDPDNDLDPRNNSQPTPVSLNNLPSNSRIGIAKAVRDTARQADGSYNVTYQFVVQSFGPDTLTRVSVSDSLVKVFNSQTGARYTVVRGPFTTSTGSQLKLNDRFDGNAEHLLVLGESTSILAAGKVDTILFVVNVGSNGSTATFFNSAVAQATNRTGVVTDVSTNGLIADLNGNGNPSDVNESEPTPLSLTPPSSAVFIPEGFSPNGDGINDLFVIRGFGNVTISLEVYNRWGHLVYKSDNYQNDWNGKANTGINVGSENDGLPDGTYYYVIRTSDGRKFVRYMTINR